MRPSTLLQEARNYLSDKDHWHKGSLYDFSRWKSLHHAQCVCAVGAIEKMSAKNKVEGAIFVKALRLLEAVTPNDSVANFNDDHGTTHDDILNAFDAAIGIARAEGK